MASPDLFAVEGHLAIITGGGGAIGCGAAEALLRYGASVVLFDISEESLSAAIERLPGGRVTILRGDVREPRDIESLATLGASLGGVDILVNCVGVQQRRPILEATLEDLDHLWSVNVAGVFAVTQTLLPQMVEKGYGKIINLCSIGSFIGLDQKTMYAITKGGLAQYTRSLALETAAYGIRVNGLAPGYVDTPMTHNWIYSERQAEYLARIPLRRYATVQDLQGPIIFLASAASDYMTGQLLVLDGGWTIW